MPSVRAVADSYAATAEFYADIWSPVIRPVGRRLLEALPLDRAGRVADIGTGVGAMIPDMRALAPTATIIGADLSPVMLRVARESCRVPLAAMDARRLALASAEFDVAVMLFMLFHVPEPASALEEAARIVRPGGTLGTVTWGDDPPFAAGRIFEEELAAAGAGPDPFPVIATHDQLDTPEKMEALLTDARIEPSRIWIEEHAHRWDPDGYKAYLAYGARKRRMETVPEVARASTRKRIHERLDALDAEGWTYRFTCVLSVGRRV